MNPQVNLIVLDFERGFGGVMDAPYNDALNLDRGAISIIDLDATGLKIVDTE